MAHLLLPDDRVLEVAIRNISPQGFMGECAVPLATGEWLGVELPGYGIARAMVRWSCDGEFGCEFRRPLDLGRLPAATLGREGGPGLFASLTTWP